MEVVSIGAHPDDIEMGTAGTLATHKKRGDIVHGILCTLGGVRGDPAQREKEAKRAAEILGFKLHSLDYPVSKLNNPSREFVDIIRKMLKDIGPDRIYTHTIHDYHQIHVGVARCVFEAAKTTPQVLSFETISSTTTDFKPNAFVDITEHIELKLRALEEHKSQMADRVYLRANVTKSIANTRYVWGKVGPNPDGFAEAFQVHHFLL